MTTKKTFKVEMKQDKITPGTYRYSTDKENRGAISGSIYLLKSEFSDPPEEISVTVKLGE